MSKYQKAVELLSEGKKYSMKVFGNSMLPLIKSGSTVTLLKTDYEVGDVVLSKIKGNWLTHKITKVSNDGRYMISNNKGRDNGWTSKIFGRVIEVNGEAFGRKCDEQCA